MNSLKDEFLVFAVCLLVFAAITNKSIGENDGSRVATVEALVERGTFIIDGTTPKINLDKVYINGHFYSDKPPMFAILEYVPYYILYSLGITFRAHSGEAYYLLTLSVIGVSSSLLAAVFFRALGLLNLPRFKRFLLTFALMAATPILYYSKVINNHTLAAALVFTTYYLLVRGRGAVIGKRYLVLSGFLAGLASGVDFPIGVIFTAIFMTIVLKRPNARVGLRFFLLGLAPPLLLHFTMNTYIFGNILPSPGHPEYFDFPGQIYFNSLDPAFTDTTPWYVPKPERVPEYIMTMFLGSNGFFTTCPILILAAALMAQAAIRDVKKEGLEARLISIGCLLVLLFYIMYDGKRMTYGGGAIGYRWLIPTIPFLIFFSFRIFEEANAKKLIILGVVLSAISLFASILLTITPGSPWGKMNDSMYIILLTATPLTIMAMTADFRRWLINSLSEGED